MAPPTIHGLAVLSSVRKCSATDATTFSEQLDALGIWDVDTAVIWTVRDPSALANSFECSVADAKTWTPLTTLARNDHTEALRAQLRLQTLPKAFRVASSALAVALCGGGLCEVVTAASVTSIAGVVPGAAVIDGAESASAADRLMEIIVSDDSEDAAPAARPELLQRGVDVGSYYTVPFLFKALRLQWMLRSQHVSLRDVIKLAVQLALPEDDARAVAAAIDDGSLRVPGREVLRQAGLKLDLLMLAWERLRTKRDGAHRYLLADSSPQKGWNFYALVEQRVCLRVLLRVSVA